MQRRRWTAGVSKALAFTAAVLLTVAGCGAATGGGGGGGDGGEKSPIKVGIIADLTGATSDVGRPYNAGMLAYIDYVNSHGGIKGHPIKAFSNDYAYEVPQALSLYRKYKSKGVVAIQGWGTGDSKALRPKVTRDKLPFMSASYAEIFTNPEKSPYNFVVAPTYGDYMRIALDWIAKKSGGKHVEVAVFHHNSPFGKAPVPEGRKWIQKQGYDIGYQAYAMPSGATSYVGLLNQAQQQGAKYIIIQNVSTPAAQVAKDIQTQGLDMKIICLNWCADNIFIETAGKKAAEGHILIQPFAPPIAEKPGHDTIAKYLEANGKSLKDKGVHYVQGWYTMYVMAQGMKQVIESGKEMTGPNLKAALEGLSVKTGGVVGGGIVDFSTESHKGAEATNIYQVRDGKMVEIASGVKPGEL